MVPASSQPRDDARTPRRRAAADWSPSGASRRRPSRATARPASRSRATSLAPSAWPIGFVGCAERRVVPIDQRLRDHRDHVARHPCRRERVLQRLLEHVADPAGGLRHQHAERQRLDQPARASRCEPAHRRPAGRCRAPARCATRRGPARRPCAMLSRACRNWFVIVAGSSGARQGVATERHDRRVHDRSSGKKPSKLAPAPQADQAHGAAESGDRPRDVAQSVPGAAEVIPVAGAECRIGAEQQASGVVQPGGLRLRRRSPGPTLRADCSTPPSSSGPHRRSPAATVTQTRTGRPLAGRRAKCD